MEELFQSAPRGQSEPVKLPNNYDEAAIHVGINDLLSSNKSVNDMQRYYYWTKVQKEQFK